MKSSSHFSLGPVLALCALASAAPAFADSSSAVAATVLEQPARTIAEEEAVLESGRMTARQRAFARLAERTDPAVDKVLRAQFERYRAGQLPPALWLDLFEAASKRNDPALKELLAERQAKLARATDPLAAFQECLEGGDADAGREIFANKPEAGCIRCHSADGKGGQIGPELTWLRHSAERVHLLESVILPNSTIATGFQSALLKLKSGDEVMGVVSAENSENLTVTSVVDGTKRQINIPDIVDRTPLPSPMPPAFGAVLSKREIRNLIEFLAEGD
jgi:putative heme-binding domain-containing protein